MKPNPFLVAKRAKGSLALFRRALSITGHYGFSPAKMEKMLERYTQVLSSVNCGASFPITAVTLERNKSLINKFRNHNIELLVHGYFHVAYSGLTPEEQLHQLQNACEAFTRSGFTAVGFRSPYLIRTASLNSLLEKAGFSYVSNQPVIWEGLDGDTNASSFKSDYERALDFYRPWSSGQRLSLPWIDHQLVEIPISFPDDEILIERLGAGRNLMEEAWQYILAQTYQQGELFTFLIHPERAALCADALSAVLSKARSFIPTVWFARLDEIADWWRARAKATIDVTRTEDGGYHFVVNGPQGLTLFVKNVNIDLPTQPWADGYRQVEAKDFTVYTPFRPFIGLSPSTTSELAEWLRQQGYLFEISSDGQHYKCYFDQPDFNILQERSLITRIEKADIPVVRIGRWPNGNRSALSITGDIDALTLWDYGLRLFGY